MRQFLARLLAVGLIVLDSLTFLPVDAGTLNAAPQSPALIHATSSLIAVDPLTRRGFACARDDLSPYPADHLVVADEVSGLPIAAPTLDCSGIIVNPITHHILVDDGDGHLAILDSHLRMVGRIAAPVGTLVGTVAITDQLVLAFSSYQYMDYPLSYTAPGMNGTARSPGGTGYVVDLDAVHERLVDAPALDPQHEDVLSVDDDTGRIVLEGLHGGLDVVDVRTATRVTIPFTLDQTDALATAVDGPAGNLLVAWIQDMGNSASGDGSTPLVVDTYDIVDGRLLHHGIITTDPENVTFSMDIDRQRHRLVIAPYSGVPYIYVMDIKSGHVIHEFDAPPTGQPTLAVDSRTGRIYVATLAPPGRDEPYPSGFGSFFALDGDTGTLISDVTIGVNPHAVLIDDLIGRAFTADERTITMMDGRVRAGQFGAPLPTDPVARPTARGSGAYYASRTRHTLAGPFLTFWKRYGRSRVLGDPLSQPFSNGQHTVQYTEHFELVLNNGSVSTEPLGLEMRYFAPTPPSHSGPGHRYFPTSHHSLSGMFLTYRESNHGATLLGAPISETIVEGNDDGSKRRYLTQWFERGSLEYHPETTARQDRILPGSVGLRALRTIGWIPFIAACLYC